MLMATSRGGKWQVRLAPIAGEVSFDVSTDSTANWYDADWRTNGLVIAVSDRGGVANLYQLDMSLGSAWRRLTSVTGAAVAPAINRTDGSIWFLSLYSRGYDLRRIEPSASAAATSALALSSALSPAAPEPPAMATTFDSSEVSPPRGFGLGPRSFRWLPQPEVDADGASAALALVSMDLIGRSQLLVNAAYGDRAAWRGGNASVDWRGSRPALELRAFDAVERPSGSRTPVPGAALLDATLAGGEAALTGDWSYDTWAARARIGGSVARARSLADPSPAAASRSLGFAAASATWLQRGAGASLSEALSSDLSAGRSFDAPFQRALASASVALTGSSVVPVRATATYGSVSSGAAPFEQIALGGNPSALVDAALLSQRIPMPALPVGIRVGSTAFTYNATLIGNPLSFYWWGGSTAGTDGRFQSWNRVVGVEWTESTAAVPIAGTPAARVQIGVGESLDAPLRHRVRAYAGVVIGR